MPGMDGPLEPMRWGTFFLTGDLRPAWTVVVLLGLAAYLVGAAALRRRGEGLARAREASFVVGALLLLWSVSSGVQVYAGTVFWMHMIQHLLLIMVVPALLVVGHPLTVLARATPGTRVTTVLRSAPVSLLTHPLIGFAIYAAVIVGTHLTGFMDDMMSSAWLSPGEQVLYLGAGYLLLLPIVGDEPIRWHPPQLMRIFLLVIAMIPDTVVGIVLLQTSDNLFPVMLDAAHSWAPDPVHDINLGGGIMWALGDGLMMVFAVGLIVAMISDPDSRRNLVGSYLEGVRRDHLQTMVGQGAGGEPTRIGGDTDVDEDQDALAAYNAMLGRMNRHPD